MNADKGVVFKARSSLPPPLLLTFQDPFIILGNETISFVRICIDGGLLHVGHSVGMLASHIALARDIHKCLAGHKEGDGCGAVSGGKRTGYREGGVRGW